MLKLNIHRSIKPLLCRFESVLIHIPRISYITNASKETFLNGSSSVYVEEMYNAWLKDPGCVHKSWDAFFRSSNAGLPPGGSLPQTSKLPGPQKVSSASQQSMDSPALPSSSEPRGIEDHLSVQSIIRSYQVRGHLISKLDPLGITSANIYSPFIERSPSSPQVVLRSYKLEEKDMDRLFRLPASTFIGGGEAVLSLREILHRLEEVYCQNIGIEYMFINNQEQCTWIRKKFETPGVMKFTKEQKRLLLARLLRSTKFEEFLAKKWVSEKRFGLEGCEVLIPAMKTIIDHSSDLGIESIVMGMPHSGEIPMAWKKSGTVSDHMLGQSFETPMQL